MGKPHFSLSVFKKKPINKMDSDILQGLIGQGGMVLSKRGEIRRKFYTHGVMRHWKRLSREVVDASFLETRLDGALDNMIEWLTTLPMDLNGL